MSKILVFGHKNPDTDTIMSSIAMANLEIIMEEKDITPCRLGNINKETEYALKYFDVKEPELLNEIEQGQKVILVDHNEFSQSVKGIEEAQIIRVVDHHKISDFKTSEPLYYTAMPVGCTATIIYDMYKINNIEINYVLNKGSYVIEPMKRMFEGIFVKDFQLFFGASILYFRNK